MQKESTTIIIGHPYDLTLGKSSSIDFYQKLNVLVSEVLEKANQDFGNLIDQYSDFIDQVGNREKAILDLLIAGVLWNEYAGQQCRFLTLKSSVITIFYKLRKKPKLKNNVDYIRGKLVEYWLTNTIGKPALLIPKNLRRLEWYLNATCEYKEELKRIKLLRKFLGGMQNEECVEVLRQITIFAEWFKKHAENNLAAYTRGLDDFLANHYQNYKGREDYFLTGRGQVEYHLNMAGAEILNRSLRDEFQKTKKKVLLLPACIASSEKCQARKSGNNLVCAHCNSSCYISSCSLEMEKLGISTVLIRHSSEFSKWLKPWANQKETGLIGVACVLNLLQGGFEMMRLGIPSQCVFLDFPACRKHWLKGVPSGICQKQVCNLC